MAPDLSDLLRSKALETAQNDRCDIKSTDARSGSKTPARSTAKATNRHGSSDGPFSIPVESGHAAASSQDGAPWHLTASGRSRRIYAGFPITRCITSTERPEAYTRWRHADERGTPFTRHATFKPPTDHLTPEERVALWDRVRQRVRCFCRDCRSSETGEPLECVMMTTRESNPRDSTGEHLHMLVHVPEEFQDAFDRLAPGWFGNTKVTPSSHLEEIMPSGKVKSGFGYLHKAADPKDCKRDKRIWYRRSGAIAGERTWSTRNLQAKARAEHEAGRRAEIRLQRERATIETVGTRRARPRPEPVPSTATVLPVGIV